MAKTNAKKIVKQPETDVKPLQTKTAENDKADKKEIGQPESDVQPVQETTGDTGITQTTQAQPESGEKEFPVQPGQGGSEQADDKRDSTMDTESENKSVEEKGGGIGDQVTDVDLDIETETAYQEAQAVLTGMVSEALENSGILDELVEVTEKRNRIAKDVFEKNPQCMILHFTVDLIPFFNKSDAYRHGTGKLKNGTIVTINRK